MPFLSMRLKEASLAAASAVCKERRNVHVYFVGNVANEFLGCACIAFGYHNVPTCAERFIYS